MRTSRDPASSPSAPARLSVPLTDEVRAAFERMSQVTGVSVGRCIGQWLVDTLPAVQAMTDRVHAVRDTPRRAVHQLHAYADALSSDASRVLDGISAGAAASVRGGLPTRDGGAAAGLPPSCNTGGKLPLRPSPVDKSARKR